MSFDATWLDLREPADHAARDAALLDRARLLADRLGRVIDLGAGTASTFRAMRLAEATRWLLLDNDAALLDRASQRHGDRIATARCDLAAIDALPLDGSALVTASALLDLAGAAWLGALAARLAALRLPVYAALSYDGRMEWQPVDAEDAAVTSAFNRDQRTDKGLGGIALGPDAAGHFAGMLRDHSYDVESAASPWQLGPGQFALQRELLAGIADAAARAGHGDAPGWLARRLGRLDEGGCTIGHLDLLAVPR